MQASDCHLPCRLRLSALVSTVATQVLLCLSHNEVVPPVPLDWFFPLPRTFYLHMVLFQQSELKYCLLSLEALLIFCGRTHSPMSLLPLPYLVYFLHWSLKSCYSFLSWLTTCFTGM